MAKMLTTLLSVLAVSVVSARQTGSTCALTAEEMEKNMMECMVHDPSLMLQMAEHMNNPQGMASLKFVCQNKKDVADVIMCMLNKLVGCLPGDEDVFKQILPSRQRWEDGIQFACDNKDEFEHGGDCMNNEMPQIMGCYMSQLSNLNFNNMADPQAAMCSVIRLEEKCIKDNRGSCTQRIVNLFIEMMEKIFPTNNCPALVVDTKTKSNPFDSILVHGQPLRYQPQGEVKYGVVHN